MAAQAGLGAGPETVVVAAEGGAQDFADFYATTFRPLCVQLYVHTGDMAEAQDLVQEAFCRAFPRWSKLVHYDDPAAWVRKVAWNLATSRWRRLQRLTDFTSHRGIEPIPGPDPERVELRRALADLPPFQRQVLVLHYVAGASVTEIAGIAGVAEGTVKSRLHRARAALAGRLGRDLSTGEQTGGLGDV
ncbi:RNA polymerase sigma24 factor [Rhizocola hellebori]|uniref:RNA polymerase sigma24 factor n=1 Tax=Rhizocola hellebori TaxID=1392758 RepID=A0A8J3Q7Z7_9ACTN|nr:SigE family RNA polymerase sigma factor [Rhizocola hellebori]GIH05551.1 RNA polymerase sigma24 factor [Rhizocola hellebori]